jgi:HSP20 family protein
MSLTLYTPFALDGLFTAPRTRQGRPWVPPVDIKETGNELIFKADIPGLDMKDIDLSLENGALTIKGQRQSTTTEADANWHRVERSFGSFERVFTLPETVDVEHVKADYKNGTLTITIPKKEIAKPRQIKVEVTN